MLTRTCSRTNSHSVPVAMQHGTATLEDSLAVFIKPDVVCVLEQYAPCYLPKGSENLCPHKLNFYCGFIPNYPNLETTKYPSVSEWINSGISTQYKVNS